MIPESNQPAAPPPLADWWGHTGLLYVGLSALAATVGAVAGRLIWDSIVRESASYSISDQVMRSIQLTSIVGAAVAVAQWFVLRRLVRRALLAASGRDLSQAERRLVRDTALWIVVTIAGTVTGSAICVLISGLIDLAAVVKRVTDFRDFAFNGLIVGIVLGTAQWLFLRRHVPGAGSWIRWTIGGAAWGAIAQGCILINSFSLIMPNDVGMIVLYSLLVFIAILSALQAVCLRRLAPVWMKRLHDAARTVPSDSATAEQRMTGSPG